VERVFCVFRFIAFRRDREAHLDLEPSNMATALISIFPEVLLFLAIAVRSHGYHSPDFGGAEQ